MIQQSTLSRAAHAGVELAAGLKAWSQVHCHAAFTWPATGGITGQRDCLRHLGDSSTAPVQGTRPRTWHFYQNVVTTRCVQHVVCGATLQRETHTQPWPQLLHDLVVLGPLAAGA